VVSKLHVISGLPRSGSTLLAALLRQNPRFNAAVTSPMVTLCDLLRHKMSVGSGAGVFFDDRRRETLLRSLFDGYYTEVPDDHVVFDTNRSWTAHLGWLTVLYPDSRVICCVREVGWIIDSVERMLNRNPLQVSRLFDVKPRSSVYERAELLMSEDGLIGQSWRTLREAWYGDFAKRLILVSYNSLATNPQAVMVRLYRELGEPAFTHDFANVAYDEPDYDANLGMPGLHKVRAKVELEKRRPGIPPDLFDRYGSANFWLQPEANVHGVTII
jgi:sulfotransferase